MRERSGTHLWLVLWRAARAVEQHAVRHIESLGLCLSDFVALEVLLHKGPLPVNAIGKRVLLTSGSITTAIDRLAARGLVERRPSSEDKRARVVSLTAAGRRLITRAFAEHERAMARAVSSLSAVQRAQAVALLERLGRGA